MNREISIAETEWQVMEVLWKRPTQTIGEIRAALADTGWSDSTIKTLVRRLVKKGLLAIDDSGGSFRYSAQVGEAVCKRKETRHFIDRIYHGSVKMMMANLMDESRLSEEEVAELLRIIEKMED